MNVCNGNVSSSSASSHHDHRSNFIHYTKEEEDAFKLEVKSKSQS